MAHHHSHSHNHLHQDHHHTYQPASYNRAFAISTVLNLGIVILQVTYGILANSLALLADAGHNLTDVFSLLLAWGASLLARRAPSQRYTYGLRRSSIYAALINALVLLLAMGAITWEAIRRLNQSNPIAEWEVITVALVAIVVNAGSALLFVSGRKQDLNLRGAFMHLLTDAAISLGVVLAGVITLLTSWQWVDPLMSLLIVTTIVWGAWGLLQDALNLAMDAVPMAIEPLAVRVFLQELPGVAEVHDLHIWGISTTEVALTAHLVMPGGHPGDLFLQQVSQQLHDQFAIDHPTLQIEEGNPEHPCHLAPESRV